MKTASSSSSFFLYFFFTLFSMHHRVFCFGLLFDSARRQREVHNEPKLQTHTHTHTETQTELCSVLSGAVECSILSLICEGYLSSGINLILNNVHAFCCCCGMKKFRQP